MPIICTYSRAEVQQQRQREPTASDTVSTPSGQQAQQAQGDKTRKARQAPKPPPSPGEPVRKGPEARVNAARETGLQVASCSGGDPHRGPGIHVALLPRPLGPCGRRGPSPQPSLIHGSRCCGLGPPQETEGISWGQEGHPPDPQMLPSQGP